MKKTITLLALCLIGTLSLAQQAPAIQWQKCLGGTIYDDSRSIQPTSDGGYIVAGYTQSNDGDVTGYQGNIDGWVVKLSDMGAVDWQKTLGGFGIDQAQSIQSTPDGGYIVSGFTDSSIGNITWSHGGFDAWVAKLDITGTVVWQTTLGGTSVDQAYSIKFTPDGGYIFAGDTSSTNDDVTGNHGSSDYWIVKLSATGTILWQKTLGGTVADYAKSIQPTPDGGYIVAGYTYSTDGDITENHGGQDAWVVKLTTTGAIEWQKTFGGTGGDEVRSIQSTPNGGYIIAGSTTSTNGDVTVNHGNGDAWVVKLSTTGAIVWQKALGGTGTDQAHCIQPTLDGGYIVAGFTQSTDGEVIGNHGGYDAWIVKLSDTGALVWQKSLGGTGGDGATSIQLTPDGGYILAGSTESNDGDVTGNHGTGDAWVVKLAPELEKNTFNNQELTLYPNPTNGLMQLQTPNNTLFNKIIITDSTGKTVLEQMQNTTQINVEKLASGLYIIKAFSGEEVFVNKFVKN